MTVRRGAWCDGWWQGARQHPSPNFDARPAGSTISLAVVHSISLPPGHFSGDAVCKLFTNQLDHGAHPYFESLRGLRVSAHFFIRRSGRVQQFVSCEQRAWHAGVSLWRGQARCNDFSIGIELEGLEGQRFETGQYQTLASLLKVLARRYPLQDVVGHEHIAPGRKSDPGPGFSWLHLQRLLASSRLCVPVVAQRC
jgi:N-acetyl-anhydromuramoyl-L-alanine amidase